MWEVIRLPARSVGLRPTSPFLVPYSQKTGLIGSLFSKQAGFSESQMPVEIGPTEITNQRIMPTIEQQSEKVERRQKGREIRKAHVAKHKRA